MRILAIETSCDETAMAIVEISGTERDPEFRVLSSVISSQAKLHAEYGGVFPVLAKREHIKNLPLVLEKVLRSASSPLGEDQGEGADIDAIAVTIGPGLEPALWTGIVFAKEFALKWNIPIVSVNHMEGHILSALVPEQNLTEVKPSELQRFNLCKVQFPAITLLVSGGHTELVLVKNIGEYEIIGETRDDAAGECFDKVGRLLGLEYPAGPQISKLAEEARQRGGAVAKLPRPMLHSKDFDFSFSGLKTAVLYYLRDLGHAPSETEVQDIARETEDSIVEVLVSKTVRAAEARGAQDLLVGGGVSANKHLREMLARACEEKGITLHMSPLSLTGDNAIMIALAGYFQFVRTKKGVELDSLVAQGTLRLV